MRKNSNRILSKPQCIQKKTIAFRFCLPLFVYYFQNQSKKTKTNGLRLLVTKTYVKRCIKREKIVTLFRVQSFYTKILCYNQFWSFFVAFFAVHLYKPQTLLLLTVFRDQTQSEKNDKYAPGASRFFFLDSGLFNHHHHLFIYKIHHQSN